MRRPRLDDDHTLPLGEVGELLIRGPMVTSGYYRDPEATKAAIVDGWLRTGDYARVDDEGYIYLLDRKKDVIIRVGNNIYSVELEYLLVRHPAIAEAAAVGVSNPLTYQDVAVFVVPAAGRTIDATTVRRWVKQHLADYAVPSHVHIVDELPRNRTGKVEKTRLRHQLEQTPSPPVGDQKCTTAVLVPGAGRARCVRSG